MSILPDLSAYMTAFLNGILVTNPLIQRQVKSENFHFGFAELTTQKTPTFIFFKNTMIASKLKGSPCHLVQSFAYLSQAPRKLPHLSAHA